MVSTPAGDIVRKPNGKEMSVYPASSESGREDNPRDAWALNNRAVARLNRGNQRGAMEDYDRAVGLAPGNSFLHYNRAIARGRSGDWRGAVTDYTEALRLAPADLRAFNNRGNAHQHLGESQEALADYTKALRLNPTYAMALHNRGRANQRLGAEAVALADYRQATKLYREEGDLAGAARTEALTAALGRAQQPVGEQS